MTIARLESEYTWILLKQHVIETASGPWCLGDYIKTGTQLWAFLPHWTMDSTESSGTGPLASLDTGQYMSHRELAALGFRCYLHGEYDHMHHIGDEDDLICV